MDLIQILKDRIIPIVLNQHGSTEQEPSVVAQKSTAIATFLPILLTILKSKPDLISSLQSSLNPRLGDLFGSNPILKDNLLDSIQPAVSKQETETLLNHSIAPTLGVLGDLAGSEDPHSISHYLQQHADTIKGALPVWATSILGGLGLGAFATHAAADSGVNSTPLSTPVTTPSHVAPTQVPPSHSNIPPREPEQKKSSLLGPILGLILLAILVGLLLRYCNKKDEPVQAEQVPASTAAADPVAQPAFFELSTDASGGLVTCQARIGNPSFTDIIQKEVKSLFNHPVGCGIDSSNQYNAELVDQNGLSSILKLLKGVPSTTLTWTGNEISLQGQDAAATQALADKIKGLVPNVTVKTEQGIDVNSAVNTSVSDAEKALASINPDQVKPIDIATALNLQIINFATGSDDIPDVNKSVLDQAAALMNRVPNVQLTVKGHTDNTGDANANKELSRERAQAVVDYLVSKGVDPSKLSAVGLGQDEPIAENTSEEGKFKNRRIAFEVTNTETGTQRTVDGEKVTEKN